MNSDLSRADEDSVFELQKIHAAIVAYIAVKLNKKELEEFNELYRKTLIQSRQSTDEDFDEGGEG